jgi:OOP family OmpA-OmpF porin
MQEVAVAVACALALGVFTATAKAQVRDINEKALLLDTRGAPVMSSGLCWHSAYGPAPLWTAGCHPDVPAPMAQYVAPVAQPVATPAPTSSAASGASAPPAPVYEKVAFDANVLFDSNKSALRPAGREALDTFVSRINGLESRSVVAVGHADRMGSERSNQVLSEDRVKTVKSYLVSKGVAGDRVQTSAKGETQPTTSATECKDANTPKNVACMQPDRHVFIEISGSRVAKDSGTGK